MPSPLSMIVRSRGEGYQTPRLQISSIGVAVLIVCIGVSMPVTIYLNHPAPVLAGAAVGLYCLFAIRVADQWQKAAVLRLGRYTGLRGPGGFMFIPGIDGISPDVGQRRAVHAPQAQTDVAP